MSIRQRLVSNVSLDISLLANIRSEVPRKKKAKRKSVAATKKPKAGRFPPHFRRSYVKLYHPEAVEEVDDPCDRCAQDGFLCYVVPGRTRKLRCLTCTTGVCSFMPKAEDTAKPVVKVPTRPSRRVVPSVPSAPLPTDTSPSKDLVHRDSIISLIHSLKELAAAADETKDKKMVWTVLGNQAKGLIEGTGFSFADLGITAFEEDDVVEGEGGEEGGENDAVESVD